MTHNTSRPDSDPDASASRRSARARWFVAALLASGVVWVASRFVGSDPDLRDPGVSIHGGSSAGLLPSPGSTGDGGPEPRAGSRIAASAVRGEAMPTDDGTSFELTARVVNSRGNPVSRFTASLGECEVSGGGVYLRLRGEFSALTPTSDLRVVGPFGEVATVPGVGGRVLDGESPLALGIVCLPPPADRTWTGVVKWSDGRPAQGVWVGLRATAPEQRRGDSRSSGLFSSGDEGHTDRNGVFELTHDVRGPRRIEVQELQSGLAVEFGPYSAGPLPEVLELPVDRRALHLRCRVVDDRGEPVRGLPVEARPPAGPAGFPDERQVLTDEDGVLEFEEVAGTSVLAFPGTGTTLPRWVPVADALRTDPIVLRRGHRAELLVTGSSYRLVVLESLDASGSRLSRISADVDGRELLLDDRAEPPIVLVPPGTHTLAVHWGAPELSEDTELCRVPFPANPGEFERVVVPLGD